MTIQTIFALFSWMLLLPHILANMVKYFLERFPSYLLRASFLLSIQIEFESASRQNGGCGERSP